jgi:hypothetical protein
MSSKEGKTRFHILASCAIDDMSTASVIVLTEKECKTHENWVNCRFLSRMNATCHVPKKEVDTASRTRR